VPTQQWDIIISTTAATGGVHIYENLASLDWKKGPSGTNAYSAESSYVSDEFLAGDIAESWEQVDTRTLIWRIRKGIKWQNKAPVNGREVTAEDVKYSFQRGQGHPQSVYYAGPTVAEADKLKIEVLDKYTVKFTDPEPNARGVHGQGQWLYIQAKEAVDKGGGNLSDWRNAVGTGPFILEDVVPDSSVRFKRNPNYYAVDPFFPQNQLPYIDILEALVITDESTRIAAMRTRKVEVYNYFPYDKVKTMQSTNPELKMRKMTPDYGFEIFMRVDIAPFSDKRVRQALQFAVDEPKIKTEYFGGDAVILGWPVHSYFKTHYTPLEQLPENSRKMFEYQPDMAKKLLADAGYPNGFKTEVAVGSYWPKGIEQLSIVKENWKVIGVDLEIKPTEASTFVSLIYGKKYPAMVFLSWGNNGVDDAFGWAHDGWVGKGGAKSVYAFSPVHDPVATETYTKLMNTLSFDEREKIRKEENLREIDLAWEISLPMPNAYTFWVPWLKGYSGEAGIGPDPPQFGGIARYVWIDRALKTQMTGIKE
ncbi:MAG: ABC transporter substrate-binding protein, partial [Dehalococcoidia bacterium]|nr:ABC transporter substrate-binding protein [Dehalococcoidia bacterium]